MKKDAVLEMKGICITFPGVKSLYSAYITRKK